MLPDEADSFLQLGRQHGGYRVLQPGTGQCGCALSLFWADFTNDAPAVLRLARSWIFFATEPELNIIFGD